MITHLTWLHEVPSSNPEKGPLSSPQANSLCNVPTAYSYCNI